MPTILYYNQTNQKIPVKALNLIHELYTELLPPPEAASKVKGQIMLRRFSMCLSL